MTTKSNIAVNDDGETTITLFSDEAVHIVNDNHPNFTRILDAVLSGDEPTQFLSVVSAIEDLDDRFSFGEDDDYDEDEDYDDGDLYWNGEPVHENLTSTILRYQREGRDSRNLVRFMERLEENPSRRSRDQLWTWVQTKDLTIDEDGFLVGWKGVQTDFLSSHSGFAIVNGVEFNGQIPNKVGNVIEMPRHLVQDDPNQGCSYGLHVGNYSYAKGWGPVLLEVKVDPADVVSVPSDSCFQKLRCCKYEVLAVHAQEVGEDLSDYEPDSTWDDSQAFDTAEVVIPPTFFERMKARITGRS